MNEEGKQGEDGTEHPGTHLSNLLTMQNQHEQMTSTMMALTEQRGPFVRHMAYNEKLS